MWYVCVNMEEGMLCWQKPTRLTESEGHTTLKFITLFPEYKVPDVPQLKTSQHLANSSKSHLALTNHIIKPMATRTFMFAVCVFQMKKSFHMH